MLRLNALLLLVPLVALGCGREVVGGGMKEKEVEAVAVSDGGSGSSSSRSQPGAVYAQLPLSRAGAAGLPQGTVAFRAKVSLVTADGDVVPLNRDVTSAQVKIAATDTALIAREEVRPTTYTHARVTFTEVAANVTSGLVIGGVSLTGEVRVGIASGDSVVVEAPISLAGTARQTLVVDLNASTWLSTEAALTGVVPASVFRSAVRVRVK